MDKYFWKNKQQIAVFKGSVSWAAEIFSLMAMANAIESVLGANKLKSLEVNLRKYKAVKKLEAYLMDHDDIHMDDFYLLRDFVAASSDKMTRRVEVHPYLTVCRYIDYMCGFVSATGFQRFGAAKMGSLNNAFAALSRTISRHKSIATPGMKGIVNAHRTGPKMKILKREFFSMVEKESVIDFTKRPIDYKEGKEEFLKEIENLGPFAHRPVSFEEYCEYISHAPIKHDGTYMV